MFKPMLNDWNHPSKSTRGQVFSNSGHPMAIESSFSGHEMTFGNFIRWTQMSGPISKGHFVWIPETDLKDWSLPQREFALWGDTVELIRCCK